MSSSISMFVEKFVLKFGPVASTVGSVLGPGILVNGKISDQLLLDSVACMSHRYLTIVR